MIFKEIDFNNIPQHVAIIMDGNGRWAKLQNKERLFGHRAGAEAARIVTETASKMGIKYLTIYAFSKENWNRPKDEVYSLMNLLISGVNENLNELVDLNIIFKIIGDKETLPENVKIATEKTIEATKNNTGLTLLVALNYGGRWEILNAVKNIINDSQKGLINSEMLTNEVFSNYLLTKEIPDPDLLIRTSGEYRISNFLLWQLSYSEIYFTDTLWPDFKSEAFIEAIKEYQKRERRFGVTSEQLDNNDNNESDNK